MSSRRRWSPRDSRALRTSSSRTTRRSSRGTTTSRDGSGVASAGVRVLRSCTRRRATVAVIEAQAAGGPVVATPVGGIPENVVDGETGLLVRPRDPVALAAAINRLLDDSDEYAERAQARVFERYSRERMIARTLALYD